MLDSRWKPKKEHLEGAAEICWTLYQHVFASGRVEVSIEALELGAKIDNRLEAKTHDWLIEKAVCYEKLIDKYRNTPNELMYCQEALAAYKEAKQDNKVRELEKKYGQIKATMPVATFTEEIDLTEYLKTCKQLAQELAQRDSGEIIAFLMCGRGLLRTYSETQESVEILSQEAHFIDRIPAHLRDARGHVIQHFREPEEHLYLNLLQNYGAHLELGKLPLLNAVFAETIRNGKLSSEIILAFLADHTWLGQTMASRGPESMKIEYKWINLLGPSVRACFRLLDGELKSTCQTDDCVLGIDSLTVKLEGLLRELCESYGIATFCVIRDQKGRKVFKEKDLNALLHEDSLRDLISQDDLLFFKFVLVEHAGYNLRNKIAHCLIVSPDLYLTDYLVLIMIALLRLAKYQLRETQSDLMH